MSSKKEKPIELKLTAELVPQTSWFNNMRTAFPRATWDKIRKQVYADYGFVCGICGVDKSTGGLHCHEIWEYDDENHIQTLRGFIALCEWCHHVKHIGLAGMLSEDGKLDYEKVVEHFMQVNNCDRDSFKKHRRQAMKQWSERSEHNWTVVLGVYGDMIDSSKDKRKKP